MYDFINIRNIAQIGGRRFKERQIDYRQYNISIYERFVRKSTEHFLYLHVLVENNNEMKEKSTFL